MRSGSFCPNPPAFNDNPLSGALRTDASLCPLWLTKCLPRSSQPLTRHYLEPLEFAAVR